MSKTDKRLINKRLALIMIAIAMIFSLFSVASPAYASKQKIVNENKTLYVKSSSANVRSGYSTKHKVLKTFKKNTKLSSYEKTTASGTVWYHIKWTENKKSKNGWISSTTVTTTAPTSVKKENKTIYVKGTKANLRSTTSTKGKVVKTFGKNMKLSSYETKSTNNQTWYHIKYKVGKANKTAWVISTEVTTKAPTPVIKKESKTFYVSSSSAKVYTSYSTNSKVGKTFKQDTKLSSYEKTTVSGKVWYHIKYTENKKSKTGWVQTSNLSVPQPAYGSVTRSLPPVGANYPWQWEHGELFYQWVEEFGTWQTVTRYGMSVTDRKRWQSVAQAKYPKPTRKGKVGEFVGQGTIWIYFGGVKW